MDLSRYLRILPAVCLLTLAASHSSGSAAGVFQFLPVDGDDDSCLSDPLVSRDWDQLTIPLEGLPLGDWTLPPSADLPHLPTDVRLRAWIEHREGRAHEIILEFNYSGQNELGIPFGLHKVEFSVLTRQGRVATSLDWTDRCSVGNLPSLLPGDTSTIVLEVPGPIGKEILFYPQLRFWGSLN